MFDLNTLALKETFQYPLKHPVTNEVLQSENGPVVINLFGSASPQYKKAVTAMQARALRRQAKKEKPNIEQVKEENISLLVACTDSAENLSYEGAPVVTQDDFRRLYSDARFSWLKDQIDEILGDVSNFLE